jgi:hypothetical protein
MWTSQSRSSDSVTSGDRPPRPSKPGWARSVFSASVRAVVLSEAKELSTRACNAPCRPAVIPNLVAVTKAVRLKLTVEAAQ